MHKILYVDVETTGLSPTKNDVLQVAAIAEIDGQVVGEFEIFCQPYDYKTITSEALATTGFKIEDIKQWHKPDDAYKKFTAFLDDGVSKYDKSDKFFVAGQNVKFDVEFLRNWAQKSGDNYFGSYVWGNNIDLKTFAAAAKAWGFLKVENLKLPTICEALGVNLEKAHNAMADIRATRECLIIFKKWFSEGKYIAEKLAKIEEEAKKEEIKAKEKMQEAMKKQGSLFI